MDSDTADRLDTPFMRKVMVTGMLLGIMLGVIGGVIAAQWSGDPAWFLYCIGGGFLLGGAVAETLILFRVLKLPSERIAGESCPHCGHSTMGLPTTVCPECGREVIP